MRDPSWDVDGRGAAAELVVEVPEGRFVEAAERGVGRRIECRFDCIIRVAEAQARIRVRVWGRLRVWPEQALQGFAGVCVAGFVRYGVVGLWC